MRVPFARFAFAAMIAVTAVSAPAIAAEDKPAASDQKVSKELAKPLTAAQKAMKANDMATALASVKEAQAVPNQTPFDQFTVQEFLANIYIAQHDYANAAAAFEAMSDSPALPADKKKDVLTNTVLLDSNAGRMDKMKAYGLQLEALGPLDGKVVGPLAVAYYNSGDTAKALSLAQQEMARAQAAGEQPQQGILDIVARTQLKSNDIGASTKTLEQLAVNYNEPNDWAQLIDLAFGTKGLTDMDALYLYRLRVVTNATTSVDDYAIMANITTKAGYPGETVAFLQHGMSQGVVKAGDKAGAQLSTAQTKATADKASLPAFAKQAEARKTGDFDVKLAEAYYGYGRYAEAAEAASRAMTKGGVKDPNEAPMVLGMSLSAQGKNAEAADAFSKASGPVGGKIAHLWTLYTQRKGTTAAAAPAAPPATH